MSDDLKVASTTDPQAIITAAAEGNEAEARIPPPKSYSEYESPRSERSLLLERLAAEEQGLQQDEADLTELTTQPEQEQSEEEPEQEQSEEEPEPQKPPEGANPQFLEEVRRAAINDAITEGRRRIAAQQNETASEYNRLAGEAQQEFIRRRDELLAAAPDREQLAERAINVPASPELTEALVLLGARGADVTLYLTRHPEEAREMVKLPPQALQMRVGMIAAQFQPGKKARSSAPAPISPVGGSSTRSSLPADQLPYQEYKAWRAAETKNRIRR